MRGQLAYFAFHGWKPEHYMRDMTPEAGDDSWYIDVFLALILLVCSITPSLARVLSLPPGSCANLYVGTWTGIWGSTNVFPDGTAKPSSNLLQEWTCSGNTYTFYVPENGRTFTNTLSVDRTKMTMVSAPYEVATRVGGPPAPEAPPKQRACSGSAMSAISIVRVGPDSYRLQNACKEKAIHVEWIGFDPPCSSPSLSRGEDQIPIGGNTVARSLCNKPPQITAAVFR
jgi:hypothetical protein